MLGEPTRDVEGYWALIHYSFGAKAEGAAIQHRAGAQVDVMQCDWGVHPKRSLLHRYCTDVTFVASGS